MKFSLKYIYIISFTYMTSIQAQYGGGAGNVSPVGGGPVGVYLGGYNQHSINFWQWLFLAIVIGFVMFSLIYNYRANKLKYADIKIVSIPSGDNPSWVREAWIGLVIPEALKVKNATGYQVIGNHKISIARGYQVPWFRAMLYLQDHHSEAAKWWQENANPDINPNLENLIFCSENTIEV